MSPSDYVEDLVYDLSLKTSCIKELFEEIIEKFLAVMLNQFRKDFLQAMSVEKKMVHRKQIGISKHIRTKLSPISYKHITEDKSKDKNVSHHLLKSCVFENKSFLMSFRKRELKNSENIPNPEFLIRPTSVERHHIQENVSEHTVHGQYKSDDNTDTGNTVTEHQVGKQLSLRDECMETVSNIIEPVAGTSYISHERQEEKEKEVMTMLYESNKEYDNEYDEKELEEKNDEICKLCQKEYEEGETWIQCDDCSGWYHRKCAGLSSTHHFESQYDRLISLCRNKK
ncbi:hypothetical protein CHS0354_041112 [Potamilus streckersoni]|uniref:Zinc finger PHD-type domain-containing protein n=1 Tax=Potamilus streckersoni TaxID=2493646 RepID=A0AAE0VV19_9BIVA|nr:hypothetical protein CHS0354_041112 [Potamilus streckersoni]